MLFIDLLLFKSAMNKVCLVSLIILSLLCSCSKEEKSKYIIGVSQCSDDLWRQTMNNEILLEASIHQNVEVDIKTVKDDTQQQIRDIEGLIESGVNLLVISPNESTAITPVVQKAYNMGIPVILVDRKIDTEDYTAYIGADNYQIGKEAGIYTAGVLNNKGNIVEIRGWNGSTSDAERHAGFIDGLKNYPAIKIIAESRGNFLKEDAQKEMAEIIKRHNDIDLVFAMNDPMALGVYEAFSKFSGRYPFIIGIDALPGEGGGMENIQKGLLDASFIYPTGGDKVIDIAMNILQKKPFDRENILHTAVVDRSNVRVLQLQTEQIKNHQQKVERINGQLDESLEQYSNQQTLFHGTILALILILLLFFLTIWAYTSKSKANKKLEQSNEEIKAQAEILAVQKEQLISLSKELEEATQAKIMFFTNISHEFKTPLTLILGPVETLLTSENLTIEQKELLNLVKQNSERLSKLLIQILEFRSYEKGKMRTSFTKSDLGAFLQDLSFPFYDFAKRRDIDFNIQIEDSDFIIAFDKEKMEKIYFNLLSNAFKYTTKGKIKTILKKATSDNKDFVKLEVFNTGTIIPKDQLDNIFERFYKVNPQDVGTGIGLALTSALVELHQGTIQVESSDEIGGTVFIVSIPYDLDADQGLPPIIADDYYYNYVNVAPENIIENNVDTTNDSVEVDNDKASILVIEDNSDMRSYIRNILGSSYNILESSDGKSGIQKAITYTPDIIISDVMMPEKDGFEVCQKIKENISTSHIPIILLTACNLDEQRAVGYESGADAYMAKPFNAELLRIRICKLIENRQKIKDSFTFNFINDTKKTLLEEQEQTFIEMFENHIRDHIADSTLNIDSVSGYMGLSKAQLYRKIKSLTNYSPNELIKIIRLKFAKDLLSVSNKSISEIAYESGFSSPSYFTKCFREFYNEIPSEYIEKYENKLKSDLD